MKNRRLAPADTVHFVVVGADGAIDTAGRCTVQALPLQRADDPSVRVLAVPVSRAVRRNMAAFHVRDAFGENPLLINSGRPPFPLGRLNRLCREAAAGLRVTLTPIENRLFFGVT